MAVAHLSLAGALVGLLALPAAESEAAQDVVRSRPGVIQFIGTGTFRHGPPDRPRVAAPPRPPRTGSGPELSPFSIGELSPRKRPSGPIPEDRAAAAAGTGVDPTDKASKIATHQGLSFDGINALEARRARNGNVFSGEPPDQGLCVGNGFVLESINTALRVRSTSGQRLTPVIDQSEFYGYPPPINRRTGIFGQDTFDITCHYDPQIRRWFHLGVTVDIHPTKGVATGRTRLDLAVSRAADPRGRWNYYAIPAQNDGTEGTPVHDGCPCFGDYPKIGVDRHGVYISTDEIPGSGEFADYDGANIYAISKQHLLAGAPRPGIVQFESVSMPGGEPAWMPWPATSPGGRFENAAGGTEYLLSNYECLELVCSDNRLVVWAIPNTRVLAFPNPSLRLISKVVRVGGYKSPPPARQKRGHFPLGQCINDTRIQTPFGRGCWNYFFEEEPSHNARLPLIDSNVGSFTTQVSHVRGLLWTVQGTEVRYGNAAHSGLLHSVVRPGIEPRGRGRAPLLTATRERTSRFSIPNHDLMHPAVGVTADGDALVSYSIVGGSLYPSSAYSRLDRSGRFGPVRITGAGKGPIDGFSGYGAFRSGESQGVNRWGDYQATAVNGDDVWIAGEYVGQTCSLAEYVAGADDPVPGFTCGGTRSVFSNFYTRIANVPLGD